MESTKNTVGRISLFIILRMSDTGDVKTETCLVILFQTSLQIGIHLHYFYRFAIKCVMYWLCRNTYYNLLLYTGKYGSHQATIPWNKYVIMHDLNRYVTLFFKLARIYIVTCCQKCIETGVSTEIWNVKNKAFFKSVCLSLNKNKKSVDLSTLENHDKERRSFLHVEKCKAKTLV